MFVRVTMCVLVLCFGRGAQLYAQDRTLPGDLYGFLEDYVELSSRQIAAVRAGKAVTILPDTEVAYEVATFGIVRVNVPKQTFIDRVSLHDMTVQHSLSIEKGIISDPPQIDDFDSLSVDEGDIETLQGSQAGDSAIKLSEESISRVHRQLLRTPDDAGHSLANTYRSILMDYAGLYRNGGSPTMMVYVDKDESLNMEQEFKHLEREASFLADYYPKFHDYLRDATPDSALQIADEILWAKDDFGTKRTVISLTHVFTYRPATPILSDYLVVSKRLYGSHYVEASMGITALVDDPDGDSNHFYLVHMNRVRIDGLRRRLFRFFTKGRITDGWVKRLETELLHVKTDAEAAN
ncbi:MAG: hypothetical protein HOH43_13785 [Candidatus Latescibacteria bacterium]|nr:hypothetical protein [Candidatus Latescibacterota bacterium]